MAIIQQKKGSACFLTYIINPGAVTEEGERNTQHGTDAHIKNKRCNYGGTTRQRILHTIEKHGRNQHAIKVNLSLIFQYKIKMNLLCISLLNTSIYLKYDA